MYRLPDKQLTFIDDFFLPFGGKLRADNRWIQLARIIPWNTIETRYAKVFAESGMGAPAKPVRMALGALIIKEKCGYTDRETLEQIIENPYLQYFIGLKEYQYEAPFDSSLMVHFRKRLGLETIKEINELICSSANSNNHLEPEEDPKNDDDDNQDHDQNNQDGGVTGPGINQGHNEKLDSTVTRRGKLILDATCAPADIRYPTDLSLLNEAREKLETIIDDLYAPLRGKIPKPRTYRQKARRDYLRTTKKRKNSARQYRKAIGKQLRYVGRNLRSVNQLLRQGVSPIPKQQQQLEVIKNVYQQQKTMYERKEHRIEDRIVSISQPHIRPIVRGKADAETEFGAKVAISLVNGYTYIEELNWNNFNEGTSLRLAVERYRQRHGYYPEAVLADKIYRNRENLRFCKGLGIRLSGPRLGRPTTQERAQQKQLERQDARERNAVEGKFGEGKRRYGLDRIMARLKETSETVIALQFLVMNLEHRLRILFYRIFKVLYPEFMGLVFE